MEFENLHGEVGCDDDLNDVTESQLFAWLVLSFTPKLGGVALSRLLSVDSPQNLIKYSTIELQSLGLKMAQIDYITKAHHPDVDACLAWKSQAEYHHILTPLSNRYPQLLHQMSSHPPVLFAKGNASILLKPQVAIVGSRNASMDGQRSAKEFGYGLSQNGFVVTSGLALGIDGYAHDGALQANGETIAVLGSGVDQVYPARHRNLAERILQQNGLLVSEFRPDAKPRAEHFPRRNRIISGLSLGVVVIEAAERSGSLITARYALEQNREVFALPGSIYQRGNEGTNRLLQEGAYLARTVDDVCDNLPLDACAVEYASERGGLFADALFNDALFGTPPFNKEKRHNPKTTSATIKSTQPKSQCRPPKELPFPELFANVGNIPISVDILAERTHIPVHKVMTQILELELSGWVSSVSGGYIRNDD